MTEDDKNCHDLKNQLGIILGFSDLLITESAAGDSRRRDLEEIHTAATAALDLLDRRNVRHLGDDGRRCFDIVDKEDDRQVSAMSHITQLIVFRLDERRYALPLTVADRVVRAVEVTPLPKAPAIVLGAINVHGRVIPVLNVRRRFLMPEREISPSDWFLLAHTQRHVVAFVVDASEGVVERSRDDIVVSTQIVPGLEQFPGVIRLDDGLVLIHDLERFLSLDETRALDDAMDEC